MAVIFSQKKDGTHYEIRTAGRSVRLYTNNVLHTQYHPEKRVTGGVWDLLAMPALALGKVRRVLLLGVGGGAAAHLLRDWCPGVHITGVELNPVHLSLARRYFDLKGRQLSLIQGDARQYVRQYRGDKFDLVIEDLFGGNDGAPDRTFEANSTWCAALGRLVSRDGALVINTLERKQLLATALVNDAKTRRRWQSGLCLTVPAYENHVGAFFRKPVTASQLKTAIRADNTRQQQEKSGQLRFRITGLYKAEWT
jgi:spermidine synthase